MDFKEGYIIVDNVNKNLILESMKHVNGFLNYTFMSLEELKELLTFKVKDEAFILLQKKFNVTPEVSRSYINELKSLNGSFNNEKGMFLKSIYDYLYDNNLIEINDLFIKQAKTFNFTFYGYPKTLELEFVISKLSTNLVNEVELADTLEIPYFQIHTFKEIDEEINFVVASIYRLIKDGVKVDDIKICNFSSDYQFIMDRYLNDLNIKLKQNSTKNILSTSISTSFFKYVELDLSINQIIEKLKEEYNDSIYLNKIINLVNKYSLYKYNPLEYKETYKMLFKEMSFEGKNYTNQIETITVNDLKKYSNHHVFLLDFNNRIPYVKKDEGFLLDKDKEELNLDTTTTINKYSKLNIISSLKSMKNLTITFSKSHSFSSSIISSLVDELNIEEIKHKKEDYILGISKTIDDLYISKAIDSYIMYNEKNSLLSKSYYRTIKYKTFDNKYKPINSKVLTNYLRKPLVLSYSDMHTYLDCPFAYFAKKLLNLDEFKSTLDSALGNFAHEILEEYETKKESFNFLESVEKYMAEIKDDLTAKEQFYFEKMKLHLVNVIEYIEKSKEHTLLKNSVCENKMEVNLFNDNLLFKGFVDKIIYNDIDGKKYVAIIDYKTGSDVASIKNVEHGQNLQLPVYIFLLRNDKTFKDAQLVGFYLQKIGMETQKENGKEKEIEFDRNLALEGFTNQKYVSLIDDTNGYYLKKYKENKDGSPNAYSLVFDDILENKLLKVVEEHIKNTYQGIQNADFKIQSKLIDDTNVSCTYCGYKDICFKTYKDNLYLKTPRKEEKHYEDE